MALTTGRPVQLIVADSVGKVNVVDETDGVVEGFLLWSRRPADVADRIVHSMWVSLCRDAIVAGKRVTITHGDSSSTVDAVQLLSD